MACETVRAVLENLVMYIQYLVMYIRNLVMYIFEILWCILVLNILWCIFYNLCDVYSISCDVYSKSCDWLIDWLIDYILFYVPLKIFHLYGDVTIAGERLHARRSGPLSMVGSLSCHSYCDTGPRFFRSHPKDRPFQSPLTTRMGARRTFSNPDPHEILWCILYNLVMYILNLGMHSRFLWSSCNDYLVSPDLFGMDIKQFRVPSQKWHWPMRLKGCLLVLYIGILTLTQDVASYTQYYAENSHAA
jgi:hypothetical protein